ncbi:MAG TPA: hypothetical protein PLG34_07520 [Spirochaetota bacterium]|jgi:PHD/YefM family antitoxin component YafN of YafNO toxin-antitoxin module|nr:MAG: hypothetical protein BWX91_01756 [Spirochaetes bacterium ADurb.Bin133]HNZ26680.1 hypothetical protein [Spirochaetota bacterium]HPY87816.1 hypothetical protein [Spirochaetota bacterium]HQB60326.1 hypothetical protein [Spirochaetota bacterium]
MKTQIIKDKNNTPVAVLLDYKDYKKMKDIIEDKKDYFLGINAKRNKTTSISLDEFKKKHKLD